MDHFQPKKEEKRNCHTKCPFLLKNSTLSGVYTSNLFNDLDFYLGQILSLYEAKHLGRIFSQTLSFIFGPNKIPNRLTNWKCRRRLIRTTGLQKNIWTGCCAAGRDHGDV